MAEIMTRADEAAKLFDMGPGKNLKAPDTKLVLVDSMKMIDQVFEEVWDTKVCSADTETTGFDHYTDKMVSYQISPRTGISYYFPFAHKNYNNNLDYDYCMQKMADVHASEEVLKVGHNYKFDYKWWYLKGHKKIVNCRDTMVMSHLIDENRPYGNGLKDLVEHELGYRMGHFKELGIWEKGKKYREGQLRDFSELPVEKALKYACADTDFTLRLYEKLWPTIEAAKYKTLFLYIEMPLMFTLARMELAGIKIDAEYFRSFHTPFKEEIEKLTLTLQDMAEVAGFRNETDKKGNREPFNPNSNPQLIKFVELLGLDTGKRSKTISKKSGKPLNTMQVDRKARASLADKHPAFTIMNRRSEMMKALSTYIEPLPNQHMHPLTGRIHSSFFQTSTDTGRLSSSYPNLQNITKKEEGFGSLIRKGFIPEPGYLFVRADFSQVEIRILAHMAKCPGLIEALTSGYDVHSHIAMKTFSLAEKYPGLKVEDIKEHPNKEVQGWRTKAKTISFALVYGATKYGLSQQLKISLEEAQALIDEFYQTYPELKPWMNAVTKFGAKTGYAETLMRRQRRFPLDEYGQRRFGWDRACINHPIQGSSAELTKWSMINIERRLENYNAKLLLSIHDEVVVEVQKGIVEDVAKLTKDTMEAGLVYFGLSMLVPLVVDVDIQDHWGTGVWKCNNCNDWSVHQRQDPNDKKIIYKQCDICTSAA